MKLIERLKWLFGGKKKAVKALKVKSDQIKQERQKRVAIHNAQFTNARKKAVAAWRKEHPGERPPWFKDSSGRLQWANRKARRAKKKA